MRPHRRTPAGRAARAPSAGFTLVELTVALVAGLIVAMAIEMILNSIQGKL